jgi:biotin synthase
MQKPERHDWSLDEVRTIHDLPLFDLVDRARTVHLENHRASEVQLSTLVSVKTGGCTEDCGYCPQSKHYKTPVKGRKMLTLEEVLAAARRARSIGATRLCMGAAWREVKDGAGFDGVIEMVRGVKRLGLETCCTLGMLTTEQASRLKDAGLDFYNHNLDTSRDNYRSIVTTHSYEDRLRTIAAVRTAGIAVCTGGIIGMGESVDDRCKMLVELARFEPHPESVPINALVRIAGTPLEALPPINALEIVRVIATARIVMPRSTVRLSAGRTELGREAQLLCLYVGANSIFYGDTLLTTPNPEEERDRALLRDAGLVPMAPS